MQSVHFLGIGGSGTSAAALIAQASGYQISGCDINPYNEFTRPFNPKLLHKGHSKSHLKSINILAVTPAIFSLDPNNEEILQAKKQGTSILTWQQFMGHYLQKGKFVIAICGTHGKSTTTAMVGLLLEDAGLDPTVELGAIVPRWRSNCRVGKGQYFVTEADEFNDNFLSTKADITIVTNIEMDHPEYFKDFEAYKESFKKFLSSTKKTIIANLKDHTIAEILRAHPKHIKVVDYSNELINQPLKIPGKFNILNASAVYQLGKNLGISLNTISKSLSSYNGLLRRFQYLGKYQGVDIYSDFAHHPTEVKVTIEAAREKFADKKIWVIFQPHMFSRTKVLFDDFVKVLRKLPVDKIIITDIYPSREKDTGIVKSEQLVNSINEAYVVYNNPQQLKETLLRKLKGADIVFFVGAGDIDKTAREFVKNG